MPLYALWSRFPFAIPSYSFGRSRPFAHFSTPSEGVESPRCLYMRCGAVFAFAVPSHSFPRSRVSPHFPTPSEGVDSPRCLYMRCGAVFAFAVPSYSFGRSRGRSPSIQPPESHFNRIYFGVHSIFQTPENQQFVNTAAHLACLKRGRMCSAFCNNLIYRNIFLPYAPRNKFVQSKV